MGFLDIFLIGVSLSMDAFAVAVCAGLKMRKIDFKQAGLIALFFGGFQALMPAIGWWLGRFFDRYVDSIGPCIAFGLLAFIGGKMIYDAFQEEKEGGDACAVVDMRIKTLTVLAVATSIDALAVGVTFGLDPSVRIVPSVLVIGATTFAISFAGVAIGNLFGARFRAKAQIAGGAILIIIGFKILLEGIGWI
jgi:putative Mn2+ efflux pump MntP